MFFVYSLLYVIVLLILLRLWVFKSTEEAEVEMALKEKWDGGLFYLFVTGIEVHSSDIALTLRAVRFFKF